PGARIGVLLDQYRDRQPQHRDQGHLQSALAEAPARLSRRLLLDHEPPQKHARHDQRRLPRHRYINRADQKDRLCTDCRGDWLIGGNVLPAYQPICPPCSRALFLLCSLRWMRHDMRLMMQGLTDAAFEQRFGAEAACLAALAAARQAAGMACPRCGNPKSYVYGRRVGCTRCNQRWSVTSGTVMADTKLPLTHWFRAMHLMTSTKQGISAIEL